MNRIWNEDDDKIQQHSLSPSEEYTKQQGELNKRTNKQMEMLFSVKPGDKNL